MLTSANRIIETPKIFVINAIYIPPETTKDILLKNALCLIKQYILIILFIIFAYSRWCHLLCFDIINCCSHADSSYLRPSRLYCICNCWLSLKEWKLSDGKTFRFVFVRKFFRLKFWSAKSFSVRKFLFLCCFIKIAENILKYYRFNKTTTEKYIEFKKSYNAVKKLWENCENQYCSGFHKQCKTLFRDHMVRLKIISLYI